MEKISDKAWNAMSIKKALKSLLWKKKNAAALLLAVIFVSGVGVYTVDARTRNEKILDIVKNTGQVMDKSVKYVATISRRIKNSDIAGNANIAYDKLKLRNSIETSDIRNQSITTKKLADSGVTTGKIFNGTIQTEDLSNMIINTAKLIDGSVTTDKIADLSVTNGKIANSAVDTAKLADSSATTPKIADSAVINQKLGADAVTTDKIQDGTVVGTDLNPNIDITTTGNMTAANFIGALIGNADTVTNGVYTVGDQTINGIKTFFSTIVGDITGNSGTVTDGVYTVNDQTINGIKTFNSTIVGDISGNAGTVTDGLYTSTIFGGDVSGTYDNLVIGPDAVTSGKIADGAVIDTKLAADAVTTDKIKDGTITGADLDPTTDIATSGTVLAGILTDGTTSMNGGDIFSSSNTLNMNIGNNAIDSDVFIQNTGAGKTNLHVEGDLVGNGSLGTNGSRWSTIYADTINFLTGLTNSDNSGAGSSINLGTNVADVAQVQIGNSIANVSIADADWSIFSNGDANFQKLNILGDITSNASRTIDLNDAANTTLTIGNSGAGVADLDVSGKGTFGGTLTIGGQLLATIGGFDITGNSDMRGDIDMHNNVLTNIGNSGTDFTGSGGLTLADTLTINGNTDAYGTLDMHNNDVTNAVNITASGTVAGTVDATGGLTQDINVRKADDSGACTISVSHGIVTGTTCL